MEQKPIQQIVERLKQANTILVTVNKNPTVDQLSACLGLTLFLNKLNKHAAAVFSGVVPKNLEFLEPEKTIEPNTDSLRDFIVSLDKEKADKLRYKVDGDVVKIFITPYKTSLSQEDFEFTQGDFNVEAIVALGVTNRDELDEAILAHGRILHDATIIGVSVGEIRSELGSINWHEDAASSLSELAARLCAQLDAHSFDNQIATAMMTGIVSETDRFRNNKTTPQVMQISAQLMAAGANQQLIADKLEEPAIAEVEDVPQFDDQKEQQPEQIGENDDIVVNEDGSLAIKHDDVMDDQNQDSGEQNNDSNGDSPDSGGDEPSDIPSSEGEESGSRPRVEGPPSTDSQLTASTVPEHEHDEPSTDGLSIAPASNIPLMSRGKRIEPPAQTVENNSSDNQSAGEVVGMTPPASQVEGNVQPDNNEPPVILPAPKPDEAPIAPHASSTLAQIEELIGSTHSAVEADTVVPSAEDARKQLAKQAEAQPASFTPPASLNALPAIENINTTPPAPIASSMPETPATSAPAVQDPNAPPPVPPPMSPQFFENTSS